MMTDSLTANPDNQAQEIASSKEKKEMPHPLFHFSEDQVGKTKVYVESCQALIMGLLRLSVLSYF